MNLSRLAIGPFCSCSHCVSSHMTSCNCWKAKQNSFLQRTSRRQQLYPDLPHCIPIQAHTDGGAQGQNKSGEILLFDTSEWGFTVWNVSPYTSHPILTTTLWGGQGGYCDPVLLTCKLRVQVVKEQEQDCTALVEEPTPKSDLCYFTLFPLSNMKNINKVFSFLSSLFKQHSPD